MKELRVLLYCTLMCVITGFAVYNIIKHHQLKKITVVDVVILFNTYIMKKELEDIAKTQLRQDSRQLDSIGNMLQKEKALNNNEEINRLVYIYDIWKTKLDNDYVQSNENINRQVWKRQNPLLNEFGTKNGYHLIIGANGMGSVLNTGGYSDVTNDAITYINRRHAEGG